MDEASKATSRRFLLGGMVGVIQMATTFAAQILLVPLYLGAWTPAQYGAFLAIQAAYSLSTLPDTAHSEYLGNEFLIAGHEDAARIRRIFWSAVPLSLMISFLQLLVVVGLWTWGTSILPAEWSVGMEVVVALSLAGMLSSGIQAIAGRMLIAFGHLPRVLGWGVVTNAVTAVVPVSIVLLGGDVLAAGFSLAATVFVANVPVALDFWRLARRHGLGYVRPVRRLGVRNFLRAMLLGIRLPFEFVRQHGIRLIIAPVSGAAEVAAFATVRTAANVALQGALAILNPLNPEIMRVLNRRNSEAARDVVLTTWVFIIVLVTPSVIVLQFFFPFLFELWTRGKLQLNTLVSGLLLTEIALHCASIPARAVVYCNNLVGPQLTLSMISGTTILGLTFALGPWIGIAAPALALLLAEALSSAGMIYFARRWMRDAGLRWPDSQLLLIVASVGASGASVLLMASLPHYRLALAVTGLLLHVAIIIAYWRVLPPSVRERIGMLARTAQILRS